MIIEPISSLYLESGDKIKANKLRMSKIKEVIKDTDLVDDSFDTILKCLNSLDVVKLTNILQDELFFEEIYASFILKLLEGFNSSTDKNEFINKLKDSYILKGIKGVRFAWTPIIDRLI